MSGQERNTWWTVVPKKAATIAETSNNYPIKKVVFQRIYVTYYVKQLKKSISFKTVLNLAKE